MPAPNGMLGSVCRGSSEANVFQRSNGTQNGGNNSLHRTVSDPTGGSSVGSSSPALLYDETYCSKPVSETKTMLWEIKDFESVDAKNIERAMNFEFEVGRLGSMERHLPRRSRWRISLDRATNDCLALRVIQLSPENKILFYILNATVMQGTRIAGMFPESETSYLKIQTDSPREGSTESKSTGSDNVFPFSTQPITNWDGLLSSDGSLFVKIKMEVLEDGSSTH